MNVKTRPRVSTGGYWQIAALLRVARLADGPCAAPKHTYIHRSLPSETFASEVEQLKRELARLQQELRAADAAGQRMAAIEILAQMLKLQSAFFERWKSPSVPPPP